MSPSSEKVVMEDRSVLRVGRVADRCDVLGPGTRAVVWVAGCPLRCRECVAPEFLSAAVGVLVRVVALAEQLLSLDVDGVTFSGGEPFAQAGALAGLCGLLRGARPELSLMSYTGFRFERLRDRGSAAQRELLGWLDVLVDGPYLPARQVAARWRGSDNQRVLWLTDRHRDLAGEPDEPAGMTFEIAEDGGFQWMGVPPVRGFRHTLEESLRAEGFVIGGRR